MFARAFELKDELNKLLGWVPASPKSPLLVQNGNQNYKSSGSGFAETPGNTDYFGGVAFWIAYLAKML